MRRTAKKKTTEKKVAARPPKADESTEFDAWASKQKQRTGCQTCRQDGINDTIRALLASVIRARAYKFSIHEMREKILQKHPDADVGQRGLERHLRTCERTLYFQARGRRDV